MAANVDETKEFLVLRYSLVEERQKVFDVLRLPTPKGVAVAAGLEEDREFIVNGVLYGFVGFGYVQPAQRFGFPAERFIFGKIAKLRQAHMGRKVPGDIVETQEDDWHPVLTIFDLHRQYILVEKDWRFGTPEQTMRALQGGLRPSVLRLYNHRIFVEGCVRKEHFWKIVDIHRKIYKLELRLISPNILETNLRAREALAALKDLFGQDQVKIALTNDLGNLNVPKHPVSNYLEYIEQGEGTWSLTTAGEHGGKKTYSSTDNIDTIQLAARNIDELTRSEGTSAVARRHEAALVDEAYSQLEKYRER